MAQVNECGSCTACCYAFPVKWMDKPMNTACQYCDNGCTIQSTKPDECRDFDCSWRQSNVDNPKLRPDRCGIIFEKTKDDEFFGTVIEGGTVTEAARRQLQSFSRQGYTIRLSEEV